MAMGLIGVVGLMGLMGLMGVVVFSVLLVVSIWVMWWEWSAVRSLFFIFSRSVVEMRRVVSPSLLVWMRMVVVSRRVS